MVMSKTVAVMMTVVLMKLEVMVVAELVMSLFCCVVLIIMIK